MSIARFLFFNGKSGNIRPSIVFLCTLFLTALLAVSLLEILILILGALNIAPPAGAIDFLVKVKLLFLKLVRHAE